MKPSQFHLNIPSIAPVGEHQTLLRNPMTDRPTITPTWTYRAATICSTVAVLGGSISFCIARLLFGSRVHFWPYFTDGAAFGILIGVGLTFLRPPVAVMVCGALALGFFGFCYWGFMVSMGV